MGTAWTMNVVTSPLSPHGTKVRLEGGRLMGILPGTSGTFGREDPIPLRWPGCQEPNLGQLWSLLLPHGKGLPEKKGTEEGGAEEHSG